MTVRQAPRFLKQLRTLVATRGGERPDRELVQRFVANRDEAAFEALLRRHGPMVLRVCRRVLHHTQDAEDAFQATFLALARKAGSLRKQESVGSWLYGVAQRIAQKARNNAARRRQREAQASERHAEDALAQISVREAQGILDEELLRLPDRQRAPLVLCCLEGLTRDEAAAQLGLSVGTLKSRLEEGRERLRRRLQRRGLCLSAVLSATLLSAQGGHAALSPLLLATTLRTATTAADKTAVSALADAVLGSVVATRMKLGAALLVAAGLLAVAALSVHHSPAANPQPTQLTPVAAAETPRTAGKPVAKVDHLGDPLPPGALMRLGTLRHHTGWRYQLLPDGETVLSVRGEHVCWMDVTTGTVKRAWPLPVGHRLVGFSPDGKQAVLIDKTALTLWDIVEGKLLRELAGRADTDEVKVHVAANSATPSSVLFSPDSRYIAGVAYMSFGYQVAVWDAAKGRRLWEVGMARNDTFRNFKNGIERPSGAPHVGFLPDGETLVLLNDSAHQFHLRDCATGKERGLYSGLTATANYQWAVAPDGRTLLTLSPEDGLRGWDPKAGRGWQTLPLDGGGKARVLNFSADGKTLFLADDDGALQVRDWPSGKLRRRIDVGGRTVNQILPTRDGRTVFLACGYETTLRHFDLETGKETTPSREGHRGIISDMHLAPDGKLVSAAYDGSVEVWDLARGRSAHKFYPKSGCIFSSLSGDGKLVAAVDWEKTAVAIHERDTGRLVRYIGTAKPVRYLAFAPGSRLLVTGEEIAANVFRVWDADTGREVRKLPAQIRARPAFSPDGQLLAAFSEKGLHVFDFPSGKELFAVPDKGWYGLAFSPDGRTLASGDRGEILLWELSSHKQRGQIKLGNRGCTALCFSADSRWLAWAEEEKIILWDLGRNRVLHTFRGHEGNVTALHFPPDGRTLISASTDSTLLVWDLATLRKMD